MLSVKNLTKIYKSKKAAPVVALNNVSVDFADTGLVFLLGKSGSGKSTLLNSIGGLDTFDNGEIIIQGKSSKSFSQSDFDSYRNTYIGFIFQEYNILEEFSVAKNLALAIELQGKKANKEEVNNLLSQVEMLDYAHRKPNELSGGQKQRVAIARALIKNPQIIMADEPTGALDSNTGKQVMETLKELSKTKLVIIVSHDREFAENYGDRIIELKDGRIISDVTKKEIEANTTTSGIKVIDNNLIYIKKGQQLTDIEAQNIANIIKKNSAINDTFISFDQQSNEKIKDCSSINDNGNKESFVTTEKDDIRQQDYSNKELKLIKSRLKAKDAFKIGSSALKYKKAKLVFTIILCFLSFALFGLVDTFASFNPGTSIIETSIMLETKHLSIINSQNPGDTYNTFIIKEDQINYLEENSNSYVFPAIEGDSYYLQGFSSQQCSYLLFNKQASGITKINQEILSKLNTPLLNGKVDLADDEICITKHIFDCLKNNYQGISSFADIENKTLEINSRTFKIVGMIDDLTDLSKYNQLTEKDVYSPQSTISYNELYSLTDYGFCKMLFVNEKTFNDIKGLPVFDPWNSFNYINDEYSNLSSNIYTPLSFVDRLIKYSRDEEEFEQYQNEIVYKNGTTSYLQLKDNQIILSDNDFYNIFYSYDYAEALKENPVLNIYTDYTRETLFASFEVVGVKTGYVSVSIVNENTFNKYLNGYKFAVASTPDNDTIKNVCNAVFDYEPKTLLIQGPSASIINNFGSTISSLSYYLLYVAIGFAAFSALLLGNFIATSISYKKREIGVLRAIGARGVDVFKIFFFESLVISIINFILAVVGTIVSCFFINKAILTDLGLNVTLLTFGLRQIILMFAISLFVAFVASFLPVRKIAKKNPVDAINNR